MRLLLCKGTLGMLRVCVNAGVGVLFGDFEESATLSALHVRFGSSHLPEGEFIADNPCLFVGVLQKLCRSYQGTKQILVR